MTLFKIFVRNKMGSRTTPKKNHPTKKIPKLISFLKSGNNYHAKVIDNKFKKIRNLPGYDVKKPDPQYILTVKNISNNCFFSKWKMFGFIKIHLLANIYKGWGRTKDVE